MVIDAVITWVDDKDPEWRQQKDMYMEAAGKSTDTRASRYRDFGTLKYLFRSIEKYAPWINSIYFVTNGQRPEWLNLDNSKIKCIDHKVFLKDENLPTFSSQAIDTNFWRIEGLSEHFIYFNDDMFLTSPVSENDFFINGLPVDMFSERPIFTSNLVASHNMLNIIATLGKYYDRKEVLKNNRAKVLCPKYGLLFFYNLIWYFFPFKKFCGLYMNHLPMSYLKSEMKKVYLRDQEIFDLTSSHRFRDISDINQFIFNYESLLSGKFSPMNMDKQGKSFYISTDSNKALFAAIKKERYKRICINDELEDCDDICFEKIKKDLLESFDAILHEKSKFEK